MAAGGFMQGVVAQQALGMVDRATVVAALLEQQDQLLQGVEEALRQPGAFEQEPVVVAARQQVAAIGRDRGSSRPARAALAASGLGQRGLELGDIQRKRRIPAPAHCLVGDFQVGLGSGQPVAQHVEELAQVGVRLGFGGVGPEEEGDLLARQRRVAMQEQIGEQRLHACGVHADQLRICQREAKVAKQTDVQCRHHPGAPGRQPMLTSRRKEIGSSSRYVLIVRGFVSRANCIIHQPHPRRSKQSQECNDQ